MRPAQDLRAPAAGRVRRSGFRPRGPFGRRRRRRARKDREGVRPRGPAGGQGYRGARVPLLFAEAGRGVEREPRAVVVVARPSGRPVCRPRVAVRRRHDRPARVSDRVDQDRPELRGRLTSAR